MTWRNLLLRAYPRTWREEYGDELAGLLAPRRLTFAVVADVLAGAARSTSMATTDGRFAARD